MKIKEETAITTEQSKCRTCEEVKPVEAFAYSNKTEGRKLTQCKECNNAYQRELYKKRTQDPEYYEREKARKREERRKKLANSEYRKEVLRKQREKHKRFINKSSFVVYAFKILTGDYAGWFYIGQTTCFSQRFSNHIQRHPDTFPELSAALQGEEGVNWNVEFLEEYLNKPSNSKALELEAKWILKYIGEGKKLLNTKISRKAIRLLFERAARQKAESNIDKELKQRVS